MRTKFYEELFGWYGTLAIVLAYALVSFGVLAPTNLWYQILNGTGALGIVYISFRKKAYQPGVLNSVWTVIAILAIVRMFFQKAVKSPEPIRNAFGIVNPVQPHSYHLILDPQLVLQPFYLHRHFLLLGICRNCLKVHANGEGMDGCPFTTACHFISFPVNPGLHRPVYGIHKIVAVVTDMEAKKVITQETIKNFRLPGADAKGLWIGPGNMPELGSDDTMAFLLN